jgi:transposase
MMALPSTTRIYAACGVSGMHRGSDGLRAQIEGTRKLDPYGGAGFVFRGKYGDLIKAMHFDGQGLCCMRSGLNKAALFGRRPRTAHCR